MTRSTLARLYQLRSNRTISPAEGNSAAYRWKYHCPRSLSVGVARATTRQTRGVQRICNPLDDATLARRIPPLEDDAHLETVVPHIFLQFDQFDLEVYEFLDVVVILRGFAWFGSVTHDPVLLDFCGLPRELCHFAASVLVFMLLLHVERLFLWRWR